MREGMTHVTETILFGVGWIIVCCWMFGYSQDSGPKSRGWWAVFWAGVAMMIVGMLMMIMGGN